MLDTREHCTPAPSQGPLPRTEWRLDRCFLEALQERAERQLWGWEGVLQVMYLL